MSTNVAQRGQIMDMIMSTPAAQIPELEFVRNKYIENYNACHTEKLGELMYHRQVIHFKQIVASSDHLKNADRFSLYACFATAAVNGYSLDPADNEVYLVPKKGKAVLWRQAGAHVKRLIRTNQIKYADQVRIVYQGDTFNVMNGRVLKHVENFSGDIMIAAYIRFQLDESGNDRFFIYRKSDWEAWRLKSDVKDGPNWNTNGQPDPGFLRTKITKHACTEKVWATGMSPVQVEQFQDIEIESDEVPTEQPAASPNPRQEQRTSAPAPASDDDSFKGASIPASNTVTVDNDDF